MDFLVGSKYIFGAGPVSRLSRRVSCHQTRNVQASAGRGNQILAVRLHSNHNTRLSLVDFLIIFVDLILQLLLVNSIFIFMSFSPSNAFTCPSPPQSIASPLFGAVDGRRLQPGDQALGSYLPLHGTRLAAYAAECAAGASAAPMAPTRATAAGRGAWHAVFAQVAPGARQLHLARTHGGGLLCFSNNQNKIMHQSTHL